MKTSSKVVLVSFVVWTLFVWTNRISNTLRSTTDSSTTKVVSTVLSVVMCLLALAVVWVLIRAWRADLGTAQVSVLLVAAIVTIVVWLVRVPQILLADHDTPFKVVHALLGVVSLVLAVLVLRIAGFARLRLAGSARS